MRLNHNCVRDLLLHIEENLVFGSFFDLGTDTINDYTTENLIYTSDKLIEAGYINASRKNMIGSNVPSIRISSITWEGHKFLDDIRDEKVWDETNKVVSKFSSVSLGVVGNVASQVITSLINKSIGL